MNQTDYDYIFKILIIGDSGVGKSSVLMRFSDNMFSQSFLPTIGVDFKIRTIESEGSIIKLHMWDTAGQERFKTMISTYYKGAHGIILMYDITDRSSFQSVQKWYQESEKYTKQNVVRILVGNKKDLQHQRKVKYEEAKMYAQSMGMVYMESSAKEKINVEESFQQLVTGMKKHTVNVKNRNKKPIQLNQMEKIIKKKNATCC